VSRHAAALHVKSKVESEIRNRIPGKGHASRIIGYQTAYEWHPLIEDRDGTSRHVHFACKIRSALKTW